MFKTNPLTRANALEVSGTPIDLKQVTVDFYCLAGTNDHITPWEACYRSARLLGGKCEFVLSNSGHIQSILNPPGNPKARFSTSSEMVADPKVWLENATKHADSWWLHWQKWIGERSGESKKARFTLGNRAYPAGEASPGTYVHER
ncbi:Poly(3-hydroxyalkanoate) polymerase subunit PhaC [compost metagenome]